MISDNLADAIDLYKKYSPNRLWLLKKGAEGVNCSKEHAIIKKELQDPLEALSRSLSRTDSNVLVIVSDIIDEYEGRLADISVKAKKPLKPLTLQDEKRWEAILNE